MNLTNSLVLGLAIAWTIPAVSQPLVWDFPRNHSCHEGLAFSDGKTGLLVWGGGDTIRVTVGRGDLWDHRGGYPWTPEQSYSNVVAAVERGDGAYLKTLFHKKPVPGEPNNPMLLPLGRVEITVAGARLVSGTLDPLTGLGRLTYAVDGRTAFVDLVLSKAAGAFVLRFSPDAKRTVRVVSSMESPRVANALGPIGYKAPRTVEGGFIWDLPVDPAVGLFAAEKDDTCVISTGRGECRPSVVGFDAAKTDSLDRWSRFWREGARVSLPDPVLQQAFEYGMYRYGSMTDPDGFPAGLQGPWLEDDRLIPWNGDYHFNINVQECYSPSFRGGHFRNVRRLFDMILAWRPRLRENARLFCGIGDGYVLPHSVDDRGTCIGGFWTGTVDHGSTAWMADLMFRYVRYSRDLDFLKNGAYDFMCGAMRVYLAMLREEGGRLVLPVGPSPEWGGADPKHAVGRNPSFQLAIIHRLAADLDEAERLMKAKGEGWCRRVAGLPKYTLGKRGIALWEGQDLTYTHRHHSHLAGFYPFDVIDLEKDRAVVEMTYFNWADHGTASWAGWSHPWASVLFTHVGDAAAAHWMLRTWERFFCNPGHGSRHDVYHPGLSVARRGTNALRFGVSGDAKGEEIMQMDGQCATVSAVLEMLAHDVNGETKFFRGCPDDWREVSFENLALADGRRVSGRRANGKVEIRERVEAGDETLPREVGM